jgi:hypothetical protein
MTTVERRRIGLVGGQHVIGMVLYVEEGKLHGEADAADSVFVWIGKTQHHIRDPNFLIYS